MSRQLTQENFIEKAVAKHGDRYNYSLVIYTKMHEKVKIICNKHGIFEQKAIDHSIGKGCRACYNEGLSKSMKMTNEQFLEKARFIHGDEYVYFADYETRIDKIKILCGFHGIFNQTPNSHLMGSGCPDCGDLKTIKANSDTIEIFIEKATKIHGDKYNYSKSIYNGCYELLIIICKKHGEFNQKPSDHLNNRGCQDCAKETTSHKLTKPFTQFVLEASLKHNNKYIYLSSKYKNTESKIDIICNKHGIFNQKVANHLWGYGCPDCAADTTGDRNRISLEEWIQKSNIKHNNFYDYSAAKQPSDGRDKVIIICPKHGDFLQGFDPHSKGQKCPKCADQARREHFAYTLDEFIIKANEAHDNKYTYPKQDYINGKLKIKIICKDHGEFLQRPHAHIKGHGCPKCFHRISDAEIEWLNYLEIPDDAEHRQVYIGIGRIEVDGYMPETNTVYEYNGDHWHGNPNNPKYPQNQTRRKSGGKTYGEIYKETLAREKLIKDAGYNLISIWESDWLELKKSLKKNK